MNQSEFLAILEKKNFCLFSASVFLVLLLVFYQCCFAVVAVVTSDMKASKLYCFFHLPSYVDIQQSSETALQDALVSLSSSPLTVVIIVIREL